MALREIDVVLLATVAHILMLAGATYVAGIGGFAFALGLLILLWFLGRKMHSIAKMLNTIRNEMPL